MKSRASKRPKPVGEPYLAPGLYHEKAVVSSFIFAPKSSQDDKFALFKRSAKCKVYPSKWAVCSGSIEEYDDTPLMAAKREITEETSLPESEYSLMVRGKPFDLKDEKLRTKWTIHPFAWRMEKRPKPIRLDWEHEEYRFVAPKELRRFDHVPNLEIGLTRVSLTPETDQDLSDLNAMNAIAASGKTIPTLSPKTQFSAAIAMLNHSLINGDLSLAPTAADIWREVRWKAWHYVNNTHRNVNHAALQYGLRITLDTVAGELDCESTKDIEALDVKLLRWRFMFACGMRDLLWETPEVARSSGTNEIELHEIGRVREWWYGETGDDEAIKAELLKEKRAFASGRSKMTWRNENVSVFVSNGGYKEVRGEYEDEVYEDGMEDLVWGAIMQDL